MIYLYRVPRWLALGIVCLGGAVLFGYDPSNPARSVLDASSPGGHALGLGIALGVAAIGVLCLLKAAR
jgi:hypothetical protein